MSTRIPVADLLSNTQYALRIRAKNGTDVSEWSNQLVFNTLTDTVLPSTPTGLVWTVVDDSFHAVWNSVTTNAAGNVVPVTRYDVELVGGAVTKIVTVPQSANDQVTFDLPFEQNKSLLGGTARPTVTIRVRAVDNKELLSAYTSIQSATNPVPAAPTGFAATGGSGSIDLVWTPPSDTDLVGYNLYIGATKIWSGNATRFTYQTSTYTSQTFAVKALDKFGQESTGASASGTANSPFTVDVVPPSAPTGLTATITPNSNGVGAIGLVSWDAITSTPDLAGYVVRYRRNGTSDNFNEVTVSEDTIETQVPLNNIYTDYIFQVRAFDWMANYSSWSTGVIAGGGANAAPASVTGLVGTPGRDSITYYWNPVADLDLLNYELYFYADAGLSTLLGTFKTGTSSTLTISALSPGTTYYARVGARDVAGSFSGSWSNTATVTTLTYDSSSSDGLAPASSPAASVSGMLGNLLVRWAAVSNADPVTYEVHLSPTSGFSVSGGTKVTEVNGTSAVLDVDPSGTPLAYGTTYYVKLVAKDRDGAAVAGTQGSAQLAKVDGVDSVLDYADVGAPSLADLAATNTNVSTAQGVADDALDAANDAQTTADTGVFNAAAAQADADDALADAAAAAAAAANAQDTADGISVGGVNLLEGYGPEQHWGNFFMVPVRPLFESLGEGTVITLSYEIKASIPGHTIDCYPYQTNGWTTATAQSPQIVTSTDWTRYEFTTTVHNWGGLPPAPGYQDGAIAWYDPDGAQVLYFRKIQIERGNRATDYHPTIAETNALISNAQGVADDALADAAAADAAAATAQTAADNSSKVYIQSSAPTGRSQDLWIDTTGGTNTPKRWNGSTWIVATDKAATDAASAASAAQTAANTAQSAADAAQAAADAAATLAGTKGKVYFQTSPPTGDPLGLWIDTDDGNKPYRWDGSTWVYIPDAGIQTAANAAAAAQTTANNAASAAAAAQSTANTAVANANTAQGVADTALSNAATAAAAAGAAQSTANTGVANAATAQGVADSALANAATAQGTANIANQNAISAQISTWFNDNPYFRDWSGTTPQGYGSYVTNPTKETGIVRTLPNAVRYNIAATTESGVFITLTSMANTEYVTIEVDAYLASGDFIGAGIIVDWVYSTTSARGQYHFADDVPSPTTGQWYRFTKVIRRPNTGVGTFIGIGGYLMAGWSGLAGITAKDVIYDKIGYRPSTVQEIEAFAAKGYTDSQVSISASGKNKITHSTSTASGAGILGDTWFQVDNYTDNHVIAQWRHDGSIWISETLRNEVIANLDAGKLTANSSFTNALTVKNTFTLGDAGTPGIIETYDYSAGTTGFKLSSSGLEINQGIIRAPALSTIQIGGGNLLSWSAIRSGYVGSSLTDSHYFDEHAPWLGTYLTTQGGHITYAATPTYAGGGSVKVESTGGCTDFFSDVSVPFTLKGNTTYTFSMYAYVTTFVSSVAGYFQVQEKDGSGAVVAYPTYSLSSLDGSKLNQWQRVKVTFTTPVNAFDGLVTVNEVRLYANVGTVVYYDALQLEQGDVATAYAPKTDEILPGVIEGGMLKPGTALVNDLYVTNNIYVGTAGSDGIIQSYNYDSTHGFKLSKNGLDIRGTGNTIHGDAIVANTLVGDRLVANTVTANKLNVVVGGGNLLINSNGANGLDGWAAYGSGTVITDASQFMYGATSFKAISGINGTGIYRYITDSTLLPNTKYTLSAWIRIPVTSGVANMNIIIESDDIVAWESATSTLNDGKWHRLQATITTNSTITHNNTLIFIYTGDNTSGAYCNIGGVQWEQGDVATAYAPKTDEILPGTITGNMLQVNTALVNNLYVGSGGLISSYNFDGSHGFQLSDTGLIIRGTGNIIYGDGVVANTLSGNALVANTVTTNKLNVIVGGGNSVPDSNFKNPLSINRWNIVSGVKAQEVDASFPGGAAMKITTGAFTASYLTYMVPTPASGLPYSVIPGQTYTTSLWVKAPSGRNIWLQQYFQDISGADIGHSDIPATIATGNWQRLVVTGVATAGAVVGYPIFRCENYVNTDVIRIAAVQFESGDLVTSYKPKIDEILPGTITGDMLQVNTAIIGNLYIGSGGLITSYNFDGTHGFQLSDAGLTIRGTGNVIHGDAVTANTLNGDRIVANTITTNRLNVIVGGGNKWSNSSFDNTIDPWSGASVVGDSMGNYWNIYSNDSAATPTIVTGREGHKAARISWTTSSNIQGIYRGNQESESSGTWRGGKWYTISFYARASANVVAANVPIQWAWNTVPDYYTVTLNPNLTTDWQRYSITFKHVGNVGDYKFWGVPGTVSSGTNWIEFSQAQLEEGDLLTAWNPKPDEILPGTIIGNMIKAETALVNTLYVASNLYVGTSTLPGQILSYNYDSTHGFSLSESGLIIRGIGNSIHGDSLVANTVTTKSLTVASLSDNLVTNGRFLDREYRANATNTGAVGWQPESTTPYWMETNTAWPGNWSMVLPGTYSEAIQIPANAFPVSEGDTLSLQAFLSYVGAGTPQFYLRAVFQDSAGSYLTYRDAFSGDPLTGYASSTVRKWKSGQVVVPSGARTCKIEMYNTDTSGNTYILINEVNCQRLILSAQIGNGQIIGSHIQANTALINNLYIGSGGAITSTNYDSTHGFSLSESGLNIKGTGNTIHGDSVTANTLNGDRLVANSVLANKLNIIVGGGNFVSNSGFEAPYETNGEIRNWTRGNGNMSSTQGFSLDTSTVWRGSSSLKIALASADNSYIYQDIAVTPGTWIVSAWVKRSSVTGGSGINVDDVSATVNSQAGYLNGVYSGGPDAVASGTADWERDHIIVEVGAAGFIRVYFQTGYSGSSTGTTWIDGVQVEKGDVPTSWAPRVDEILPGTIRGEYFEANTGLIHNLYVDSGGTIQSTNFDSTHGFQLSNNGLTIRGTGNVIHGESLIANTVKTNSLTVASVGDNLILNGNMADYDANYNGPFGWNINGLATGMALVTFASQANYMQISSGSGYSAIYQGADSGRLPVSPNQQFYVEATAVGGGSVLHWYPLFYLYDRDNNFVTSVTGSLQATDNSGHGIRGGSVLTIPNDSTIYYARTGIELSESNQTFYFRNVAVTRVQPGVRIENGAITGSHLQVDTALIHNLYVGSGGTISSTNYNGTNAGFQISETAIKMLDSTSQVVVSALRTGTISAANMTLASGGSIILNGGYLKSNTYNGSGGASYDAAATAGFYLGNDGLVIAQGSVKAPAIKGGLFTGGAFVIDTGGTISSANYSAGAIGWLLGPSGLEVNGGTIRAAALVLQQGENLLPPQYADFEFSSSYYVSGSTIHNSAGTLTIDTTNKRFNTQSLKFVSSGAGYVWFGGNTSSGDTVELDANTSYIVSWYGMIPTGATASYMQPVLRWGASTDVGSSAPVLPANSTWNRYYSTITTGSNTGKYGLYFNLQNASTYYIDGVQVERKLAGSDIPSPWTPPGITTLNGYGIRTGSIESTSLTGIGSTPLWSIPLNGSATFQNLLVRGASVIGSSGDGASSYIQSYNYSAGTTGWRIDAAGNVDITSGTIKAAALQVQLSNNILPSQYADFEAGTTYYADDAFLFAFSGVNIDAATARTGTQFGYQFWSAASGASEHWFGKTFTDYNITINPSTTYIISGYYRKNSGTVQSFTWKFKDNLGTTYTITPNATTITNTTGWVRLYGTFTTNATSTITRGILYQSFDATVAGDVHFDALQMEVKSGTLSVPSDWAPSGGTSIDGSIVKTNGIQSVNYVANTSGWKIDAVGYAEFTSGQINGNMFISGSVVAGGALSSGERIVIRKDGSGGIIETYSGVSGETPGTIDPSAIGGFPTMKITSGTTSTWSERPSILLSSSLPLTSTIDITAAIVKIGDPTLGSGLGQLVVRSIGVQDITATGHATFAGTGWQNISFSAGWSNFGNPFQPGQYKRVGNRVTLRGMVQCPASPTFASTIFNLPAGYRVSSNKDRSFAVSANAATRVDVVSNGDVKMSFGNAVYLSLDQIEFDID